MAPVILIDVDGVLADFSAAGIHAARGLGASHDLRPETLTRYDIVSYLPESARPEWWATVTAKGFCAALQAYPGAAEAVRELRQLGDVVAVTAPMGTGETWCHERRAWLRDRFGFHRENVISTAGKMWVPGDFYADDVPANLFSWVNRWDNPRRAFLIDRAYNGEVWRDRARGSLADFVTYVREYLRAASLYEGGHAPGR